MIKLLCLILVLTTSVNCGITSPRKLDPRITGTGYSEIKSVPYQAQLVRDGTTLFCGATIINEEWLISASHCFLDENELSTQVLTGSTHRLKGEQNLIDRIYRHPEFDENSLDNDICLIKLKNPLQLNENQTAISVLYSEVRDGQMIQISGYGRESDYSLHSPVIKVARVPVVNKQVCNDIYHTVNDSVTTSMFCAGDGLNDACVGDSGGPAVSNGYLVGVITAGRQCGSREFPGVYTKLSIFRDWIEGIMRFAEINYKDPIPSKPKVFHTTLDSQFETPTPTPTPTPIMAKEKRFPGSSNWRPTTHYQPSYQRVPIQYQPLYGRITSSTPSYYQPSYGRVTSSTQSIYYPSNKNSIPSNLNTLPKPMSRYEWNESYPAFLQERISSGSTIYKFSPFYPRR